MLGNTIQNGKQYYSKLSHPENMTPRIFFCTIAIMRYVGTHIKQHSVNSGTSWTENLQPIMGLTLFVTCAYYNSVLFTSL